MTTANHSMMMMMMMRCFLLSLLGHRCVTVDAFSMVPTTTSTRSSSPPLLLHMSSITTSNNNNESPVSATRRQQRRRSDPTDLPVTTTLDTTTRDDNIETNMHYLTNLVQTTTRSSTDWMELPASYNNMSRRRFPETDTTKFEIVLGRLAMMGAVVMALREWNDGSSIIEQVMTTLAVVVS